MWRVLYHCSRFTYDILDIYIHILLRFKRQLLLRSSKHIILATFFILFSLFDVLAAIEIQDINLDTMWKLQLATYYGSWDTPPADRQKDRRTRLRNRIPLALLFRSFRWLQVRDPKKGTSKKSYISTLKKRMWFIECVKAELGIFTDNR